MMRREFPVALIAAMLCFVGMTRDARATVTFDLIWTSTSGTGVTGTNSINADPGNILQLEIRMVTGQTLSYLGISLDFDTDLGNELNLIGAREWSGTTYGTTAMTSQIAPIGDGVQSTLESTGGMAGRINTFESGLLTGTNFLPLGTYAIGTARFVATSAVATDGNDVFSGLFNVSVDSVGDNTFSPIPVGDLVTNGASVNIPEPSTVSLLGLGLVGLVLALRRSRRSE